MVLAAPARDGSIPVIDASERGVHINMLDAYAGYPARYDIGVKRFPGLTVSERERIVAFARAAATARYDILRVIGFLIDPVVEALLPRRLWLWIWEHVWINRQRYVCSTLVQKAFVHGVDPDRHAAVYVRPPTVAAIDVECTSAADFARAEQYAWIFNPHL